MRIRRQWLAGVVAIMAATPVVACAQTTASTSTDHELGAMATGTLTSVSPAIAGRRATEGYLSQPNVMGALTLLSARNVAVRATGTLNFEGYTLKRGELTAGSYGEGYVDRRHPHTLAHEAMLTTVFAPDARAHLSVAAGKGFVPYGTDDPMVRPFAKYPVNHHHAQLLERIQGIAAVQGVAGAYRLTAEQSWFNGDEPVDPFTGPQWSRVGDSHATRLTVQRAHALGGALDAQASRAFVRSPGITQGGAFDHLQWSASVRWRGADTHAMHGASHSGTHSTSHAAPSASPRLTYVMAEVARTDETLSGTRAFRFESALTEAAAAWGRWHLAARLERTERPEPERLLNAFRTPSGHIDFQIVGVTRWTVATVRGEAPAWSRRAFGLTPFAEVAYADAQARRRPAVFEPAAFYGRPQQWHASVGARLHLGTMRSRMGRYGVLDPTL